MAKGTILKAKNNTGATLKAGSVVYLSGYDSSDNTNLINLASCNNVNKMPAIGILTEDLASDGSITNVKISGAIGGFGTFGIPINTVVYVGINGTIVFEDPELLNVSFISQQLGTISYSALYPYGIINLFSMDTQRSNNHVPVGSITMWAGTSVNVPSGWLLCQGQQVSKTTYSNLYIILGNTWGPDNGNSFTLPDLVNYFPVGAGDTYPQADVGGSVVSTASSESSHTHVGASHSHSLSDGYGKCYTSSPGSNITTYYNFKSLGGATWTTTDKITSDDIRSSDLTTSNSYGLALGGSTDFGGNNTSSAGSPHSHTVSTISPYVAIYYIIKY